MAVVTLPSKREILVKILSDNTRREECALPEAWDKAIEWALSEYDECSSLEELVEDEDW